MTMNYGFHYFVELSFHNSKNYTFTGRRFEFKDDAQHKFFRPRAVPYALAPKVEKELDRLQKTCIIEPAQ